VADSARLQSMSPRDEDPAPATKPGSATSRKAPPKLFECKLCGKVFDADEGAPSCPECDSRDVEQVG
jgi:rubrerythrin